MRIVVPVVVEMTSQQVGAYAGEQGLPHCGYVLHDSDIREDVRSVVLAAIKASPLFEFGASVSLKER
jgi:hypothetical protein